MPIWSGVNIDGVMLKDLNPQIGTESDRENWNEIHKKVIMRYSRRIRSRSRTRALISLQTPATSAVNHCLSL